MSLADNSLPFLTSNLIFFTSSKQSLDLIPLRSSGIWKFDQKNTIHLQGAHGEDIVRSVWLDDKVCIMNHKQQITALGPYSSYCRNRTR